MEGEKRHSWSATADANRGTSTLHGANPANEAYSSVRNYCPGVFALALERTDGREDGVQVRSAFDPGLPAAARTPIVRPPFSANVPCRKALMQCPPTFGGIHRFPTNVFRDDLTNFFRGLGSVVEKILSVEGR